MNLQKMSLPGIALALLTAASALAQQAAVQANPTPGCSVTPAQLDANKKVALAFMSPGGDRLALMDSSYKQHNPANVKTAKENNRSDYEQAKVMFGGGRQGGGRGPGAGRGNGPQPPQGNQLEIVTAECDIVTVVHKQYRQDPTMDPGNFYEAFTFDTLRVKDGKVVEHWDGALINPNPPAGGAPAGGGPGR
jgi:predicted SnoaL-like aldol condensation-catalyzing enzyme